MNVHMSLNATHSDKLS